MKVLLETENKNKLVSLNNDIAFQKVLIAEVKTQEQLFSSKVTEAQELVQPTIEEVKKIRTEAPSYEVSRGTAPVSDGNVIAYSFNFLGIPYL